MRELSEVDTRPGAYGVLFRRDNHKPEGYQPLTTNVVRIKEWKSSQVYIEDTKSLNVFPCIHEVFDFHPLIGFTHIQDVTCMAISLFNEVLVGSPDYGPNHYMIAESRVWDTRLQTNVKDLTGRVWLYGSQETLALVMIWR